MCCCVKPGASSYTCVTHFCLCNLYNCQTDEHLSRQLKGELTPCHKNVKSLAVLKWSFSNSLERWEIVLIDLLLVRSSGETCGGNCIHLLLLQHVLSQRKGCSFHRPTSAPCDHFENGEARSLRSQASMRLHSGANPTLARLGKPSRYTTKRRVWSQGRRGQPSNKQSIGKTMRK